MSDWITIGTIEDIPKLGSRVVATADGDIAVFRTSDDKVFALRDHCPHKGGPLSQGIVYGHKVACPLHNWSIDLETGEAVAPDKGCSHNYPVQVEDGVISIAASAAKITAM
jgi:nitrite reductase (NADH) small subunit